MNAQMKKIYLVFAMIGVSIAVLAIAVPNALAVDSLKGKGSVGGALSYSNQEFDTGQSTSETDAYTLTASLGYFFTDYIEVNFSPFISSSETDSGNGNETTNISYSYFGNIKFNLYREGWTAIPYIGIQGGISGYESDNTSDDNFGYGGMAGLKVFLNESVSMNFELNYMETEFDDELTMTDTRFLIGFTYYFGGN